MLVEIEILKSGSSVSLQDKGRSTHMSMGVPISGFADRASARTSNLLLGNKKNNTVIEWSLIGPQLRFPSPTFISISHSTPKTTLNGTQIRAKEKILVNANSILKLGAHPDFPYQYLAIKGGFQSKQFMGSHCSDKTYLPFGKYPIHYKPIDKVTRTWERPSFQRPMSPSDLLVRVINAYPGPEFHLLDHSQIKALEEYFTLSSIRNRMGIQLNELVVNSIPSMLSRPVLPGTLQLTPSGKLILLGKDCQTTGGYPRLLWLDDKSLAELYQLPSGVKFRFEVLK